MIPTPDVIETDVAVVGSGAAGLMAAIHASAARPDLDITVVSKGIIGRSGCSIMVVGLNASRGPDDSVDRHFRDIVERGLYLNDQELAWNLAAGAPSVVEELESYGCYFDRDPNGDILLTPFAGQSTNRHVARDSQTGFEIMSRLRDQIYRVRPRLLEEVRALDLLLDDDGAVAGLALLDINSGRPLILKARSVVVATGGASTLYRVSSPAREKTGDGMAMSLRAGAELRDMEMMFFLSVGLAAAPSLSSGMLLAEVFRRIGGELRNSDGERFMATYEPEAMEASGTEEAVRALYTEIKEGRGSPHGGVWIDVSHLGAELLEERFPDVVERSRLVGTDITTGPAEVAPVSHFQIGGVVIDTNGETRVPGLFVAGEDAGGAHGAAWTGGNGIVEAMVFGARAGRRAADVASARTRSDPAAAQGAETFRHCFGFLGEGGAETAVDLASELKEAMWQGAGPVCDRAGLDGAQEAIHGLKARASRLSATGPATVNVAWQSILDLHNQIAVAETVVAAATAREESRGVHFRVDHPDRDDAGWLRYTVASAQPRGLQISTRPVQLTRLQPGDQRSQA